MKKSTRSKILATALCTAVMAGIYASPVMAAATGLTVGGKNVTDGALGGKVITIQGVTFTGGVLGGATEGNFTNKLTVGGDKFVVDANGAIKAADGNFKVGTAGAIYIGGQQVIDAFRNVKANDITANAVNAATLTTTGKATVDSLEVAGGKVQVTDTGKFTAGNGAFTVGAAGRTTIDNELVVTQGIKADSLTTTGDATVGGNATVTGNVSAASLTTTGKATVGAIEAAGGAFTVGTGGVVTAAGLNTSGAIKAAGGAFTVGTGGVVTAAGLNTAGAIEAAGGAFTVGTGGAVTAANFNGVTLAAGAAGETIVGGIDVTAMDNRTAGLERRTSGTNESTYLEGAVRVNNNQGLAVLDNANNVVASISRDGNIHTQGNVIADGATSVLRVGDLAGKNVRAENGVLSIKNGAVTEAELSAAGLTLAGKTLTGDNIANVNGLFDGIAAAHPDIYANNAEVKGTLSAADGKFKVFNNGRIEAANGNFVVGSNGRIETAGGFVVDSTGKITANKLSLGGLSDVETAITELQTYANDLKLADLPDKVGGIERNPAGTHTTIEQATKFSKGGFSIKDVVNGTDAKTIMKAGTAEYIGADGTTTSINGGNIAVKNAAGDETFKVDAATGKLEAAGGAFKVGENGGINAANGNFTVSKEGNVEAKGTLSAADGKFFVGENGGINAANGNFTVSKEGNVEAKGTLSAADGKFFVGENGGINAANGNFTVSKEGNVEAKGTLSAAGGAFRVGEFGGINAAGGNFTVTKEGAVTAKSLKLATAGDIEIGAAVKSLIDADLPDKVGGITRPEEGTTVIEDGAKFTEAGMTIDKESASTNITAGGATFTDAEGTTTINGGTLTLNGKDVGKTIGGIERNEVSGIYTTTIEGALKVSDGLISNADGSFTVKADGTLNAANGMFQVTPTAITMNLGAGYDYQGTSDGLNLGYVINDIDDRLDKLEDKTQNITLEGTDTSEGGASGLTGSEGTGTGEPTIHVPPTDEGHTGITGDVTVGGNVNAGSGTIGDVAMGDGLTVTDDNGNKTTIKGDVINTGEINAETGDFSDSVIVGNEAGDKTTIDGGKITTGDTTINGDGMTVKGENDQQTTITGERITVDNGEAGKIEIGEGDVAIFDENGDKVTSIQHNYDEINRVEEKFDKEVNRLDNRITQVEDRVDKVGAMSAAIANLRTMGYDPAAPTEIAVGIGQYRSETGVALGMFHYPNKDFMLSLSLSTSGDEVMGGIGATWKFGRKTPAQMLQAEQEKAAKAKVAKALAMKKAAQEAKVAAQQARHAKMAAAAK